MIIRKITPKELKRTSELFSIAFEYEMDNDRSSMEFYEAVTSAPKSREDACWQEHWAAFEDDNETMMSFFLAKPMPANFDGHRVTMTGIGGVSTLPQYRRRGGIRGCFVSALPAMYDEGIDFSYLYPFSTAYYRKFGYELCCDRNTFHVRLSSLRQYPVDGTCTLLEQRSLQEQRSTRLAASIKTIYESWQTKYNMMILNEEYEYAWIANANPPKDQTFTYVYESKEAIPMAFMTFRQTMDAAGRNLTCSRFFFTCPEGLKGLLNLAASLASDHGTITFSLPTDLDISLILPEWSMGAASVETERHGMARVINAAHVLRMARYQGDGSLILTLRDAYIPQNNNTFEVIFQNGQATQVSVSFKEPDITMEISDFSRLITGACDTASLPCMDTVNLHHPAESLSRVFYRKPILITESF